MTAMKVITAKEMADNAEVFYDGETNHIFTPEEFRQFYEQLCREQRRICKNEFDRRGVISEEDVRSGEMPEL